MKSERATLREEMRAATEQLLAKVTERDSENNRIWIDEAYRRLGRVAIKVHFFEKGRRQARRETRR